MNNKKTQNLDYDIIINMRYFSILFLITVLFFGLNSTVNSQVFSNSDTNLIIEFVPEIPKANELVYVTAKSFSLDVDSLNFTWRVNGRVIKSGIGEKNFSFTMGREGERTNLDITATGSSGSVIEKNYSFVPTSVDLIWQSSGYVPPFYKGKALFSHQNTISIIAIPHIRNENGVEMNPRNMIYRWTRNGSFIESASGFGKNVYTFESPLISRNINISVEVTPQTGPGLGFANITLIPNEPTIQFYKKDPVYGIQFQKALVAEEDFGNSNEISIHAVPYFFDNQNNDQSMLYKWLINGTPVSVQGDRNQTFRKQEGVSGTSNISLSIENLEKLLQSSTRSVNLTFKR